ncbi:hypothetical protein K432DRAFT_421768 [Lepidopterella palustris CBS 459.81]|uniref:BZIP domain-containing protein n=1 Tax=Lepidopterella palustris CBS 459.81 TaxID=1314670 RepID=A0A8E2EK55_9PEZI|nr:hypothetical protein K432DRAFT_421768 [Lepidopterella palustris CBS 459.81]
MDDSRSNQMRPKKDASQLPKSSRVERKRTQNRLSQQCVREKQQAYARQLESFVDFIKISHGNAKEGQDSRGELVRAHLALVQENQQLRDALLRMRKKLLSLSNSASAAADDEIIEQILQNDKQQQRKSTGQTPGQALMDDEGLDPHQSTQSPRPENEDVPPGDHQSEQLTPRIAGYTGIFDAFEGSSLLSEIGRSAPSAGKENVQDQDPYHVPHFSTSRLFESGTTTSIFQQRDWTMDSRRNPTSNYLEALHSGPQTRASPNNIDFLELSKVTGNTPGGQILPHGTTITPSPNIITTKVTKVCMTYMSRILGSPPLDGLNAGGLITNLAATASYFLGVLGGLEAFMFGTNAGKVCETIIRWRMMPTAANCLAIPEPFKPTHLQRQLPNHPLVFDFIMWPTVRDHLILHSHQFNSDDMIADILLNTVIDVPERDVAVNVYDLYYVDNQEWHNLAVNNGAATCASPNTVLCAHTQSMLKSKTDISEDTLLREVSLRMSKFPSENLADIKDPPLPTDNLDFLSRSKLQSAANYPSFPINELAQQYGINRPGEWKLTKSFSERHPFLQCASVTSSYYTASCASVLCC